MNNTCGLSTEVINEIKSTISKYPQITHAKIFGSRAKGNFRRYSDIDLAVFGEIDLETLMKLKDDFEELDVIYRFDIVHYETLNNSELKNHIQRIGILLEEFLL